MNAAQTGATCLITVPPWISVFFFFLWRATAPLELELSEASYSNRRGCDFSMQTIIFDIGIQSSAHHSKKLDFHGKQARFDWEARKC